MRPLNSDLVALALTAEDVFLAWLTLLLFGSLGVLLALGLPMAFCTGSLAVVFLFVFGNSAILNMMPSRIFPFMTDYQLSAVPLFIFMAAMLEKAGIIEELFDAVYRHSRLSRGLSENLGQEHVLTTVGAAAHRSLLPTRTMAFYFCAKKQKGLQASHREAKTDPHKLD
jgi:hypothetical protein